MTKHYSTYSLTILNMFKVTKTVEEISAYNAEEEDIADVDEEDIADDRCFEYSPFQRYRIDR